MSGPCPTRSGLDPDVIAGAFRAACLAELTALKPGNVHVYAPGHGMAVTDFEAAAEAAAPFVAEPCAKTGARIRAAVAASMETASCNTNLGIVLLSTPLAVAAERRAAHESLRQSLLRVLDAIDLDDTADIYSAIRHANPGGLGRSDDADVSAPPTVGLIQAMRIAAPRDRIAANYATGFRDIFEDHLPMLSAIEHAAADAAPALHRDDIVATLYLDLLARFPDSHIARKFGDATALRVQQLAHVARQNSTPLVTPLTHPELIRFDAVLKANGWNPGTTADFVVATLFAADLEQLGSH